MQMRGLMMSYTKPNITSSADHIYSRDH